MKQGTFATNSSAEANEAYLRYVDTYQDIERDFKEQVASFGLPFAQADHSDEHDAFIASLVSKGISISNDAKSIHTGWISRSCIQCRKGLGTATFLLSVQCPKNCFFCFNPNQVDYDRLLHETNDVISEITGYSESGKVLDDIALTGGEPLLHKQETLAFFAQAKKLYPDAYTRLYTSGAFLDEKMLQDLQDIELQEIRFSVKMEESVEEHAALLSTIELSKSYVENIVVEMPVMPDEFEEMKHLITALDEIGIAGINLLELCYPLNNAEAFKCRGYSIKHTPYRVLYNYWYAGGLPISGSEITCLHLVEYAADSNIKIGVHYCSLENKFSGQIYLQNKPFQNSFKNCVLSERDYFLKIAKGFGGDINPIAHELKQQGLSDYRIDRNNSCIDFSPLYIPKLAKALPDIAVGIGYCVAEGNLDDPQLKELKIGLTSPRTFRLEADL